MAEFCAGQRRRCLFNHIEMVGRVGMVPLARMAINLKFEGSRRLNILKFDSGNLVRSLWNESASEDCGIYSREVLSLKENALDNRSTDSASE
jgi:hypothetical protein